MALTIATEDDAAAGAAFDAGRTRIEEIEACLSRFRPSSELVQLNGRAGHLTPVSPLLCGVLRVALQAARRTGGLCTPTLLLPLERAGYDRDFAQLPVPGSDRTLAETGSAAAPAGSAPEHPPHAPARAPQRIARHRYRPDHATEWRRIRLIQQPDGRALVRLPRGVALDLAGVAKGWTADRVADFLAQTGPCLVDAGGDLAARGAPTDLRGWPVAVADPFHPDIDLGLVLLHDAGIATSGTDFRRWSHRGHAQHHLIDPRTGQPSRTDVVSATVIAATAADADIHAKAALLHGSRAGLAYLTRHRLPGLIVRQDGRVLTTPNWSAYAITG